MSDGRVIIDITADTASYEKAVTELGARTQKRLQTVSGVLDKAGSALTKSITVPALGAATAVGSIFLTKGWNRLEAIDTAKSKLTGLGYTAADIDSIMNSALTSVKGTAYGLGSAATTAVGALAAGVKQGDDLTRVLRTIGDVATIAGGDFEGVATVFNKVMSKGKLQGDEILQLSERGVPVLQILAKHLGTTAEEVQQLASDGKISFATFEEAMRSAFGGAALASGESMRGTIENTWAAVSRVGAAFLEGGESGQGFFNILKPLLGELTDDIDGMSETAGEWGAAFGEVVLEGTTTIRELLALFDELSPSEKQQVIQLAAMAVAAGPLLKVGSKLVSGTGLLVSGLSKSAAVSNKAISTSKALTNAYQAQLQGQQRYIMAYDGCYKTVKQWDAGTQSYVKTSGRLKTALASTTTGAKVQAAASLASSKAMDVGKVAAKGFGTALKSIAPIAIISGIIALVSATASWIQKANTQTKATEGLTAAASGATIAIDEETGAITNLNNASASVNIDQMAQQHADLAQSITDTNQSMASSAGMLSSYGDTIGALADRSDLSEEEVASLKLAVEGMNDACGTSYTVAQDTDGAWRVMADGAIVAKDAILSLIDTQLAQIRLEAEKENYKAVYEQLTKDAEAYASAQANATSAQEALNAKLAELGDNRYIATTSGIIDLAAAEQDAFDTAQKGLAEVESQMGATQSASNRLEEQQKLTTMAMTEGANEILKIVDSNLQFKAAVQQSGVDLVAFTQSLIDMGFTAEQVAAMTPEQAAAMAQGWQSGSAEMLLACQNLGIEVPAALNAMGTAASLETYAAGLSAGQNFTNGLSSEAQNSVSAALNTVGLSSEAFGKLATLAGIKGDDAAIAFANQLAAGQVPAELAAKMSVQGAESGLASVNGLDPANDLASQFYTTLGSSSNLNASTNAGEDNANAGYEGVKSKEADFKTAGVHAGENFASGLSSTTGTARSAASAVMSAVASVMQFSVPDRGPFSGAEQGGKRSGRHLVQNIAAGILAENDALTKASIASATALQTGLESATAKIDIPIFDIPVGISLPGKELSELSAFGFEAALEDRSSRNSGQQDLQIDLSPVTEALERIEEQLEESTARTEEAYRHPVRVDFEGRQIGRVFREYV